MRIGWVDFSEEERRRANQVLQMAKGKGAIDELGLGVLRDSFSYRLFPGTSTLHTHARYYFLTAYLMKDLARDFQGAGRDRVHAEFEYGEKSVAQKLSAWCDENGREKDGITGISFIDSDTWVKQKPASMNWSAMREYGLLKDPNATLSSYLNMVAAPSAGKMHAEVEGDDAVVFVSPAQAIWDVPAVGYEGWRSADSISVDLLPCEARMLLDSICRKFPNSLYAALLQDPKALDLCAGFGSFVELADNLEHLVPGFRDSEALALAADTSALAALLHIRFNYVLRHFETYEADKETEEAWESAYAHGSRYRSRALDCDIESVFSLLSIPLSNSWNAKTYRFLKRSQEALREGRLEDLDEIVRLRELKLKGRSRSKIMNADAYRSDWYGGTELTYRLSTAISLGREICAPLEGVGTC